MSVVSYGHNHLVPTIEHDYVRDHWRWQFRPDDIYAMQNGTIFVASWVNGHPRVVSIDRGQPIPV